MLRLKGILLFLFIPIVLILYLVFPLGVLPSVILGIVLMLGHRFIARPFMFRNLEKRCVWNGSPIKNSTSKFQFVEGDKLSDALLFAYGIDQAYENVINVEISRLSYDGKSEELIEVKIGDEFVLKRGDRIRVIAEDSKKKDVIFGSFHLGYLMVAKKVFNIENGGHKGK